MLKQTLKGLLPEPLRLLNRRLKRLLRQRRDRRRSAAEVFGEIYRNNLWGGQSGEFFSGEGTHHIANDAYVDFIADFASQHGLRRIIDIGCGDFKIGRQLAAPGISYHGIDVVAELIERNNRLFGASNITFSCLDATRDELPDGDLVLVREVLQHLSNDEIAVIFAKLATYPFALITEYQPAPEHLVAANIDKAHGMDTRIWDGSAVYPERAPFSLPGLEVVLSIPVEEHLVAPGERVVSYLLRNADTRRVAA